MISTIEFKWGTIKYNWTAPTPNSLSLFTWESSLRLTWNQIDNRLCIVVSRGIIHSKYHKHTCYCFINHASFKNHKLFFTCPYNHYKSNHAYKWTPWPSKPGKRVQTTKKSSQIWAILFRQLYLLSLGTKGTFHPPTISPVCLFAWTFYLQQLVW